MKPPTKFQLMRAGRNRLEKASAECGFAPISTLTESDFPTMEIDGVKYREAPDNGKDENACEGCSFQNVPGTWRCLDVEELAFKAFGGECAARRVIYIKAEA